MKKHLSKSWIFLALCVQFFVSETQIGAMTCQETVSQTAITSAFQQRKIYEIQFRNIPETLTLSFQGTKGGNLQFSFPSKSRLIDVNPAHIAEVREVELKVSEFIKQFIGYLLAPIGLTMTLHGFARDLLAPLKLVKVTNSLRIYTSRLSDSSIADRATAHIEKIDASLSDLGINPPDMTRLILVNRTIIPNFDLPVHRSQGTVNLWDFSSSVRLPSITIRPKVWNANIVEDASILKHERAHSALHRTYSPKAYVNKNVTIQEGLANFLSAHSSGNPMIGPHISRDGNPFFELSHRYSGLKRKNIDTILDLDPSDAPSNSLLISQLLWNLRQQLGSHSLKIYMKSFLDSLNEMRSSYEDYLRAQNSLPPPSSKPSEIYDLYYAIVVLKTVLGEKGLSIETVDSFVKELKLDEIFISDASQNISRNGEDYSFQGFSRASQSMHIISGLVSGTLGALWNTSVLVTLIGGGAALTFVQ